MSEEEPRRLGDEPGGERDVAGEPQQPVEAASQAQDLGEFDAVREDVQTKRERVRGNVTGWLIAALFLLLIGGIVAVFSGPQTWSRYDEFARFAVPAVVGLLGSAIGFYFGSQK